MIRKAKLKFEEMYVKIILNDENNKHAETITFASIHLGGLLSGKEIQVELEKIK